MAFSAESMSAGFSYDHIILFKSCFGSSIVALQIVLDQQRKTTGVELFVFKIFAVV